MVAVLVAVSSFVLGHTGVYSSCPATIVPARWAARPRAVDSHSPPERWSHRPAFGRSADTFGYRAGRLPLAVGSAIEGVVLVGVVRADPSIEQPPAAAE